MPTKDYMSIRGLVKPQDLHINKALESISKKYKVCSRCEGKGYLLDDEQVEIFKDISTVKVKGNQLLESLKDFRTLNSNLINVLLEIEYYGRKHCNKCKGLRLIKRKSRKKNGSGKT